MTTYAVHPGVVATELSRHLSDGVFPGMTFVWDHIMKLWIKTPEQGAQTTIHCAVDEEAGGQTGLYYRCVRQYLTRQGLSMQCEALLQAPCVNTSWERDFQCNASLYSRRRASIPHARGTFNAMRVLKDLRFSGDDACFATATATPAHRPAAPGTPRRRAACGKRAPG